jgi:hypothetical protein
MVDFYSPQIEPAQPTPWPRLAAAMAPLALILGLVCILSGTRLSLSMLPYSGVSRHLIGFGAVTLCF